MLRLYHYWSSVCSQKVRIALAEKGLDWESRHVDLFTFEQWTPAYLALNPKAVVPVLEQDGHVVTESNVICEYLEDVYRDVRLRPADPKACSIMRRWLLASEEELHGPIATASFNPRHRLRMLANYSKAELAAIAERCPFPDMRRTMLLRIEHGLPREEEAAAYRKIDRVLDRMEAALEDSPWLAGAALTLADIAMAPYVNRVEVLAHPEFISGRPRISDWWARMQGRPGFKAAMAFKHPHADDVISR